MKYFAVYFLIGIISGCSNLEIKSQIPTSLTPSFSPYIESVPNSFEIQELDKSLVAPTRIKITPDGQLMFLAELGGMVWLYRKVDGTWVKQEEPFFNLGDIGGGLDVQKGLAGLFFGADFSANSPDPLQREIFLTYAALEGEGYLNRITRVTSTYLDTDLVGADAQLIYEGQEPPGGNHQIQDGIGLIYEGSPHIMVAFGDAHSSADSLDESKEGRGKILLMQRDGKDPLGPRPFSLSKIQAIGARNPYGLAMLPELVDPKRRVLGIEPGINNNDRIWLLELVDFGHEEDAPMTLGYEGSDSDSTWTSIPDLNNPGPPATEGILNLINPTQTPTSVSLHMGKGIIPSYGPNHIAFLVANLGNTSESNDRGRSITMGVIDNLDNQPTSEFLTPIIERSPEAMGEIGSPLAMDVDPATGDILFADVFTGELFQAVPKEI